MQVVYNHIFTQLFHLVSLFHPKRQVWVAYPYGMGYKKGKGEFMTTAQISERLVTYGNIKKPMALGRVGVLMGSMGYRSVTRGNRQARLRGWIVYQRDTEEIAANKKLLAKESVTV